MLNNNPRFFFKVPRVLPNQREVFEKEDFFKKHSKEGEVRAIHKLHNPSLYDIWGVCKTKRMKVRRLASTYSQTVESVTD